MNIKSVSFDLFDTLIDFDFSLMPVVEIEGKIERTTSKVAYDRLYKEGFDLPTFFAFHVIWQEINIFCNFISRTILSWSYGHILIKLNLNCTSFSS